MNAPPPTPAAAWLPRLLWLLPVAAAALVMLPSVSGELVWDDVFWKRQIVYFTSLATVLRPPADIPDWPAGYFRPVATLSYLLDLRLYGPDSASGRHLSNIVYHALNAALVWLLARRLLAGQRGREAGALFAALFFAVHPIHTESVCWVGARVDVLATLFVIPAVLLALAWRDTRSIPALIAGAPCLLLAMGAKEVGAAGLALVPLALLLAPPARPEAPPRLWQRPTLATWGPLALLLAATAALYAWLRLAGSVSLAGHVTGASLLNLLRAGGYYLGKLVWPWPHSTVVDWAMVPGRGAALAIVAAALALGAVAAVDAWRRREATLVLGLLWIVLALAPSLVVALSSFATYPVAERYLYLPSVGAALAFGALVGRLTGTRARPATLDVATLALAAAIVAGLGVATWDRSRDWSSNVELWSATTRQAPGIGQPWVELGLAYYGSGDFDAALEAFETARGGRIDPGTLAVAEYHAGVIHLRRRDLAAAEDAFARARAAQPDYPLAAYGQGRVYYEQALEPGPLDRRHVLLQRSQQAFREAIRLSPGFGEPRLQMVRVLLAQGDLFREGAQDEQARRSHGAALAQLQTLLQAVPTLAAQPDIAALRAELQARAGD